MELLSFLKIIAALMMGFIIPGLLISMLLKDKRPWLPAYAISCVLLFNALFLAGISGIKLNFINIISIMIFISLTLTACLLASKRHKDVKELFKFEPLPTLLTVPVIIVLLLLAIRAFCQPMISPDSVFRWNYLPMKMIETGSFSFYPPMTAENFRIYFYADGIPPLVQFSYFLLYSAAGDASRTWLTAIPVLLQFISIVFFCYFTASHLFQSPKAGIYSILLLLSSVIFFFSIFIGQETGLTALSVAGMFYYLCRSDSEESLSNFILAGIFSALGALSREYGTAFLLMGILACLWRKTSMKNMIMFIFCSLLFSSPWYVYLWIHTGNPFYTLPVGSLFPVNEVFDNWNKMNITYFGLGMHTYDKILYILKTTICLSPIHLLLLPAVTFLAFRKLGFLAVSILIVMLIWIYSIGYTCGGIFYSMRVLSPMIVLLSIAGAGLLLRIPQAKWKTVCLSALLGTLAWGIYLDLCIPVKTYKPQMKDIAKIAFGKMEPAGSNVFALAEKLPQNAKVLSDSALLHAAFMSAQQEKRRNIDFMPFWSPEVSFLFKENCSFAEACSRLKSLGFKYVLYSKDSYNNVFLERYVFFREYRVHSRMVSEDQGFIIFELQD